MAKSFDFYKARFADASGFTFVFVGNFKTDSIKPLIAKWLGALPSTGRKETWRDTGIRPPTGVVQRVVKRGAEPKARTALIFTGPLEYNRQNRYYLSALAELLNIKLREALRENLGGTYGVSVSPGATRDPQPSYRFTIGFGSAPERLEALTTAALAQIDSVKRFGTTPEYLNKVKEAAFRARETAIKQNGYWLSQIATFDQSGWPLEEIPNGDKLISSLTADDRTAKHSESGDAAEDPERASAPLRWVRRAQQRQPERHHERRAGALDGPSRDQPADAGRERARGRCEREQSKPGREQPSAAEPVPEHRPSR